MQILTQKALADEGLGDAYLVPIIKKKVEALRIIHQPVQVLRMLTYADVC